MALLMSRWSHCKEAYMGKPAKKIHARHIAVLNEQARDNAPHCRLHVGTRMLAIVQKVHINVAGDTTTDDVGREFVVRFRCPVVQNGHRCEQVSGIMEDTNEA